MAGVWSLLDAIGPAGLILAIAAMAAGAAAQTAIGMGLNLFTVGILALIDPVFVPGPVLVHGFLLSAVTSYRLRADINLPELGLSLVGLIVGTLAAALLLSQVSAEHLPRLFGALILLAVAIVAAGLRLPLTTPAILGASAASGVMGTIAGAHGPPIALLYQRETPLRIRAALLPFFAFANPIAIAALAGVGMFSVRELYASALLLPGLVIGYLAAPLLIRVLSPAAIRAAILLITALSGLVLVVKG